MYNLIQALSNFTITLLIVNLLNYDMWFKGKEIICIDLILVIFFIISCVCSLIMFRRTKHSRKYRFSQKCKISDTTLNRKVLEVWFMTMAPLLAITPDTMIKKWLLFMIFIFILRLINAQKLFVYNILYPLLGYNYYEIMLEDSKTICITKLNKIQLNEYISSYKQYLMVTENTIYIPKIKQR